MKKKANFFFLSLKRYRKRLKRIRKKVFYNSGKYSSIQNFRLKYEEKVVKNYNSIFFNYLIDKKFITGIESKNLKIDIPHTFCLNINYNWKKRSN